VVQKDELDGLILQPEPPVRRTRVMLLGVLLWVVVVGSCEWYSRYTGWLGCLVKVRCFGIFIQLRSRSKKQAFPSKTWQPFPYLHSYMTAMLNDAIRSRPLMSPL
jgi:hypothetical protein